MLNEFEKIIGYKFNNIAYLETALSHSSYSNEHSIENNERLEFLGDSVLSLIVSEKLFKLYGNDDEGDLSKIRAFLVCEHGLYTVSKKIMLAEYIRLGKGEEATGGRKRPSVISDAFEALLAAIFLDSDFITAKNWLLGIMEDEIEKCGAKPLRDYKSMLQEVLQKKKMGQVEYELIAESGPDHNKSFTVAVIINGEKLSEGSGKKKKDAEQIAAKNALEKL